MLGTDAAVRAAILRYGIWIDPQIYRYRPHLVPFSVRDAAARSRANSAGLEEWGSPNASGFFRDDNSLIKEWVKALPVKSPNPHYNGRRAKSGFVACHVWRGTQGGAPLHSYPLFNSFVPNLVWLPRALARRSDVIGSYSQHVLQHIAYQRYRELPVPGHLRERVLASWKMVPPGPSLRSLGKTILSEFSFDRVAMNRKHRQLEKLVQGVKELRRGCPPKKIQSSRYGPGLAKLPGATLDELIEFLEPYILTKPDELASGM